MMSYEPAVAAQPDGSVWFQQGPNVKFKVADKVGQSLYLVDYVKRQPRYVLEQVAIYDSAPDPAYAPLLQLILRVSTVVVKTWCAAYKPEAWTERLQASEAIRLVEYATQTAAAKAGETTGTRNRAAEPVWSLIQEPVVKGQAALVLQAMRDLKQATLSQVAEAIVVLGLQTRQAPERVAYWYLKMWEKDGLARVQ